MEPSQRSRSFASGPGARAFTLIELLIVVAIICILLSMALMAFKVVRSAGHNTHCSSNLRGLGMALLTYSRDFGGRLPYRDQHSEWQNQAVDYLEDQSQNYQKGTHLIFHCPFAEKEITRQWTSHAWRYARHYNMNSSIRAVWDPVAVVWSGGRKPARVASLPGSMVLLADGMGWTNGAGEVYFEDAVSYDLSYGPWPVSLGTTPSPSGVGRIVWHASSVNLACMDGSVERVKDRWSRPVMQGRFTDGL